MTENTTEATASETTNDESAQTSQEIDWKQESRKWETRAKENITPEKHQEKVSELEASIEAVKEENATALQEKTTALETAEANLLRYKLALKHGLDEEDLELFLTASDEETLEKQAQRISERNSASALRPDPAQGRRTGTGTPSTADAFAQAVEGHF